MKTAVYLCSKAIAEQFNISGKDSVSGHEIAKKEQENFYGQRISAIKTFHRTHFQH